VIGARAAAHFTLDALARPPDASSRSRRCRGRLNKARATVQTYNGLRTSLQALSQNLQDATTTLDTVGDSLPPAGGSSRGSSAAQQLRLETQAFRDSERFVSRLRMADRAATSAESGESLPNPPKQHTTTVLTDYATLRSQAVPLVADRVSLPDSLDAIELAAALPPEIAKRYEEPFTSGLIADLAAAEGRPAAFRTTPEEYLKLVRRLLDRDMVVLSRTARVVNGLFAVNKEDGKLRLIVDCRPSNPVFVDPEPLSLPTPDKLASLRLPRGRPVLAAHADMDNAFHRMRVPPKLRPFFALPAVRAGDIGPAAATEFGPEAMVYPLLTRLPMGWSHSPYLCQQAHRHIVLSDTRFKAEDEITADNDDVVDRPRWGVYLDDFTVLSPADCGPDSLFSEYLVAIAKRGLPPKPSKTQPPAAKSDTLGMHLDCASGTIGVAPDKLMHLCVETEALLARGEAGGRELSSLVGKWTWAMLPRRPALATFNAVYHFARKANSHKLRLWPTVKRELRVAMGLVPVLYADIKAPWAPLIVATDASEFGQGIVARPAEPAESEREVPLTRKSPATKLPHTQHLVLQEATVAGGRWSTIVSSRWRFADHHINTFELRAVLTASRWLLSRPALLGTRVLFLIDSSVAVHAIAKGRSSSFPLLRILRQLAATCLVGGFYIWPRWVPTNVNPADAASRR